MAHTSLEITVKNIVKKDEECSAYLARVEAFWPGLVGCGPFTPSISRGVARCRVYGVAVASVLRPLQDAGR